MNSNNMDKELYFLMAKWLKDSPCEETFKKFLEEANEHDLFPERYDWTGDAHQQTFEQLEHKLQHIKGDHLRNICSSVFPLLDTVTKKTIAYEPSLLRDNSAFQKSKAETGRRFFSMKDYVVRRHCLPLPEPTTFRKHNIVKALYGRQLSGPFNRKHLVSGCPYKSMVNFSKSLCHLSPVYCVAYDSAGRYIYTGADDSLVKVWHVNSGRLLSTLRGASAEIADLAVNSENTLLGAACTDKVIQIWCLQTSSPVATLGAGTHSGGITGINFCPSVVNGCRYLSSISTDGSVAFWKYAADDNNVSFEQTPVQYMEKMRPGKAHIFCGSFSAGGMFFAAGSADHHVRVYKMAGPDGHPSRIMEKEAHQDVVDSIQFAHTHLKFASGSKDGFCLIWYYEEQTWKYITLSMTECLPGVKIPEEDLRAKVRVTMIAWDKSDQWVITSSSDKLIRVWNSSTGKLIQMLNGHKQETFVLESHPLESQILLSAGYDGKINIWNILTGEILVSFQNLVVDNQVAMILDAKWSPDGTSFSATDGHGRLLTYGIGYPGNRNMPYEVFFHTDYRPLIRSPNNEVLDEQTGIPPHLMPPPFLVDKEGNPYPPYLQRLVPGRELCDTEHLIPNAVLNETGQQEVIMGIDEAENLEIGVRQRSGPTEGVRQSSGDWQIGDDITWTKRIVCQQLDKYRITEIAEKTQFLASLETEEYKRESKKSPPPLVLNEVPKRIPKRTNTNHGYRTRASRTDEVMDVENGSSSAEHDENYESARESELDSSSSSSDSDTSSEYSDWTPDPVRNRLEPPRRIARVRNVRRATKIKKIVANTTTNKKPAPADIAEEYRPSEWLSETMPKKAPYIPQMGDEVMFFKQGYNLYLNAVQTKQIYAIKQAQLNPWSNLKLKEPQVCKVIGIKYELRPPRLCGLRLTVLNDDGLNTSHTFQIKYHDIKDVIDFLVLRQLYDTAMNREWKPGDRFRSAIDDAWWCGKILCRSRSAQSPFLCYKVKWDTGDVENLSPWDLEYLNSRREPQNGHPMTLLPREIRSILYEPEPDEWLDNDQDDACERILERLTSLMGMSIAEHFLVPVDISIYPSYAYVVEYPIDLSTIKARFENRFYRRLAAAQFDARYIAYNAEKFNERGSDIVKNARIITDVLLQIMREHLPLDVPALCRQLQENYNSAESSNFEDMSSFSGTSNRRTSKSKRNIRKTRSQRLANKTFNWKIACKELLHALWTNVDGEPFREPVDRLKHPDYDKIIDTPMDLGIIREELKGDNYNSPNELWKDLKTMFNNAKNFTPDKRSRIYGMTVRLSNLAEEEMKMILSNYRSSNKSSGSTTRRDDSSAERYTRPRRSLKRRRSDDTITDEGTTNENNDKPCTSHQSQSKRQRSNKKESIATSTSAATYSPRKTRSFVVESHSEEEKRSDESMLNLSNRSLRARKKKNYAEMLHTQLSSEEENDNDMEVSTVKRKGRPKKIRKESTEDDQPTNRLRRNLQVHHYNEESGSASSQDSDDEDDTAGLAIELSVSSRGRTRKLTAKARASVFSVGTFRRRKS